MLKPFNKLKAWQCHFLRAPFRDAMHVCGPIYSKYVCSVVFFKCIFLSFFFFSFSEWIFFLESVHTNNLIHKSAHTPKHLFRVARETLVSSFCKMMKLAGRVSPQCGELSDFIERWRSKQALCCCFCLSAKTGIKSGFFNCSLCEMAILWCMLWKQTSVTNLIAQLPVGIIIEYCWVNYMSSLRSNQIIVMALG